MNNSASPPMPPNMFISQTCDQSEMAATKAASPELSTSPSHSLLLDEVIEEDEGEDTAAAETTALLPPEDGGDSECQVRNSLSFAEELRALQPHTPLEKCLLSGKMLSDTDFDSYDEFVHMEDSDDEVLAGGRAPPDPSNPRCITPDSLIDSDAEGMDKNSSDTNRPDCADRSKSPNSAEMDSGVSSCSNSSKATDYSRQSSTKSPVKSTLSPVKSPRLRARILSPEPISNHGSPQSNPNKSPKSSLLGNSPVLRKFSSLDYDGRCKQKFDSLTSIMSYSPWRKSTKAAATAAAVAKKTPVLPNPPRARTSVATNVPQRVLSPDMEYADGEASGPPSEKCTPQHGGSKGGDDGLQSLVSAKPNHPEFAALAGHMRWVESAEEVLTVQLQHTNHEVEQPTPQEETRSERGVRFEDPNFTHRICFINEDEVNRFSDVSDSEDPTYPEDGPGEMTNGEDETSSRRRGQQYSSSSSVPASKSLPSISASAPDPDKHIQLMTEFLVRQKQLEEEAKFALTQAKSMARMQVQLEAAPTRHRSHRVISQVCKADAPRRKGSSSSSSTCSGGGSSTDESGCRAKLTQLSRAQLEALVNTLVLCIQETNVELMEGLELKDSLRTEQEDLLTEIEDLTRHAQSQLHAMQSLKLIRPGNGTAEKKS